MAQRLEMLWFEKRATLGKGSRVLEFGCGRGAGARLILEKYGPSFIVAQDLDFTMVRKGRKFLTEKERKRIALSVGDAYRMPFQTGCFDAVFSFGVLHHIPEWQTALSEVARLLKPSGLYVIEELYPMFYQNAITGRLLEHPKENRFESHDLKQGLEDRGLIFQHTLEMSSIGLLAVAEKRPQGNGK
jgi:ubiquinone/menaquinone biosynthesis C-methylase UbiE